MPATIIRSGANVYNFVKCPFCAGHETVSPEAAAFIEKAIAYELDEAGSSTPTPLLVELSNIRNAILNMAERAIDVDPLLE